MTIGIIGAGALGSNLARALAKAGLPALISNSRGPESLQELVQDLGPGITAVTTQEAARADIVVVAVRWVEVQSVLGGVPDWNDRIVIDATNPVEFLDPNSPDANDPSNPLAAHGIRAVDLKGQHSSALVRGLVPGARVIKAFNHLNVKALTEANLSGGRRVQFYSGDDASAKADVRALIDQLGFFAVDLGTLDVGGPLTSLPFGSLAAISFIKV